MLYRTRSYPGGLCQQSIQSTFHTDRNLAKPARHSDQHGSSIFHKPRRFEASGCHEQKPSRDKQNRLLQPSCTSLTKPNSPSGTRSRRDCLTSKESTNELVQVALIPASLFQKESSFTELFSSTSPSLFNKDRPYTDLYLSSTWESYKGEREATSQVVEGERNDEPESNNYEGLGDLHLASDSFVRWQELKADGPSMSTSDALEVGASQNGPIQSDSGEGSTLRKIWKKKKERRRIGSLILLNVLAALYGSSNVANVIVSDAAPTLPVSLTSLVRFTSALIFFAPALMSALKNRDMELLRAGAELGGLAFAATVVDSCNPTSGGSSSSAALLFAFTVIFVPIMELCAGRRSGSTLTRFATFAAIAGMGLLEEEGFGWRGISCPQIGDLWGMAVSIISAVHIFRSESHGGRFDPLLLNAVQCGVLAILSLGWESLTTFDATAFRSHEFLDQIQSLPWAPLIYNGLVCFGLCSWLELHGLRSIHASTATLVYTTIPVWGAFLSFFAHHEAPAESAVIGGLVIMVTSIYFQLTTSNADTMYLSNLQKRSETTSSNLKPDKQEVSSVSQSDYVVTAVKDEYAGDKKSHGYFPGALLTSQLKFPYYAAQAKKLLAELKVKLGAIKSILLTTASSGIVTSTTGTSTPGPATVTAPTVAPSSNINGANSLPGSTSTITTVTSHIAKVDVSTTQHIAPHGPSVLGPASPAGSDFVSEALKTSHTSDFTAVVVNVGSHTLTAVTTGFESALIVVGSDIMLGFEEAEDAATLLERLIQVGVENATHSVAACLSGGAIWLDSSSNFVQSTADALQRFSGENIVLPFPSDVAAGVTDSFLHNVAPLLNHIQ